MTQFGDLFPELKARAPEDWAAHLERCAGEMMQAPQTGGVRSLVIKHRYLAPEASAKTGSEVARLAGVSRNAVLEHERRILEALKRALCVPPAPVPACELFRSGSTSNALFKVLFPNGLGSESEADAARRVERVLERFEDYVEALSAKPLERLERLRGEASPNVVSIAAAQSKLDGVKRNQRLRRSIVLLLREEPALTPTLVRESLGEGNALYWLALKTVHFLKRLLDSTDTFESE